MQRNIWGLPVTLFIGNLKIRVMSRLQTLRMIACMLLMGGIAIAAYLFYQHSLYFACFFADDYGRYYHLYLSVAV